MLAGDDASCEVRAYEWNGCSNCDPSEPCSDSSDDACCGDQSDLCPEVWTTTDTWINMDDSGCHDTDFFRLSEGCGGIKVATGNDGSGDVYTYDSSVLVCGYDDCEDRDVPGCDTVRSIFLLGGDDDDDDDTTTTCERVWGYSSERCGEMDYRMDCNYCDDVTNANCDWGNYFDVIDANPYDFGYQLLWSSGQATDTWIGTPHDLDALRMSPAGCTIEVSKSDDGSGEVFTYDSDVRVCGNSVGCDSIRSLKVLGDEG